MPLLGKGFSCRFPALTGLGSPVERESSYEGQGFPPHASTSEVAALGTGIGVHWAWGGMGTGCEVKR